MKNLVVITGLAGSGKTIAVHALEDLGYYCIDNLPACLMPSFVASLRNGAIKPELIALALDSRDLDLPKTFRRFLSELEQLCHVDILFLYAREEVLANRFKETRRLHPLSHGAIDLAGDTAPLLKAIHLDRDTIVPFKQIATKTIDTSAMSSQFLRQLVRESFAPAFATDSMSFHIVSFGFKHGVPQDLDMIMDVRCFKNPHYEDTLRPKTGLSPDVSEFVLAEPNVKIFIEKLIDMILFLYPLFLAEGKKHFSLGIGCTGGKHRSVAIVEEVGKRLRSSVTSLSLEHRHFDRE